MCILFSQALHTNVAQHKGIINREIHALKRTCVLRIPMHLSQKRKPGKEARKGSQKRRSEKKARKGSQKRKPEKETRKGNQKRKPEKEARKKEARKKESRKGSCPENGHNRPKSCTDVITQIYL